MCVFICDRNWVKMARAFFWPEYGARRQTEAILYLRECTVWHCIILIAFYDEIQCESILFDLDKHGEKGMCLLQARCKGKTKTGLGDNFLHFWNQVLNPCSTRNLIHRGLTKEDGELDSKYFAHGKLKLFSGRYGCSLDCSNLAAKHIILMNSVVSMLKTVDLSHYRVFTTTMQNLGVPVVAQCSLLLRVCLVVSGWPFQRLIEDGWWKCWAVFYFALYCYTDTSSYSLLSYEYSPFCFHNLRVFCSCLFLDVDFYIKKIFGWGTPPRATKDGFHYKNSLRVCIWSAFLYVARRYHICRSTESSYTTASLAIMLALCRI